MIGTTNEPQVADLVRTPRHYGILARDQLLERSAAELSVQPSFDAALRRGIEEGSINHLGAGLFELGQDAPDLNEERFDPPW
jgi:hypothetical protein